jgi:hypothetical protein
VEEPHEPKSGKEVERFDESVPTEYVSLLDRQKEESFPERRRVAASYREEVPILCSSQEETECVFSHRLVADPKHAPFRKVSDFLFVYCTSSILIDGLWSIKRFPQVEQELF